MEQFVERVGRAGVEIVFAEGIPALAVVADDIAQAAVGNAAFAHFDPQVGDVLSVDPVDFDETQ